MIQGMEHHSFEDRTEKAGEKRRLRGYLTAAFQFQKRESKKEEDRFFHRM